MGYGNVLKLASDGALRIDTNGDGISVDVAGDTIEFNSTGIGVGGLTTTNYVEPGTYLATNSGITSTSASLDNVLTVNDSFSGNSLTNGRTTTLSLADIG